MTKMTSPTTDEIRAARKRSGLTQTEAGALIYCTLRGWQDWEGGKNPMHPAFWDLFRRKARELRAKTKLRRSPAKL